MSWFNRLGFIVWAATALIAAVLAIQEPARCTMPVEPAASQSRKWQGHRFGSRFLYDSPQRFIPAPDRLGLPS